MFQDPLLAFGSNGLLKSDEFEQIWMALFDSSPKDASCGRPHKLQGSDSDLIRVDSFLVRDRGFLPELCRPESWFVASARIDPCRLRSRVVNRSVSDILRCSKDGKYSEIRFVFQPVVKHDRGSFFPDAALHVAFSITDREPLKSAWRELVDKNDNGLSKNFFKLIRTHARFNDASLFISGRGLERWTFARANFNQGLWIKDQLAHGRLHESLSDADLESGSVRTSFAEHRAKFSDSDFLDPLRTHPLQGSCVSCHLAQKGRPDRLFRQLGWGLSGEGIVSERVRSEAHYAAQELNLWEHGVDRK